MPLISVIVPVYKVEPYICRCVDSILSQTFTDFELILIDDGSPDDCPNICNKYALQDSRIHVIHQDNGGLSAARNAGLDYMFAHSDSEWITFVDSDDWVSIYYLEYLYKAVISTGTNISSCAYKIVKEEPLKSDTESINYVYSVCSPEEYYINNRINAIVAWGKLYRKQLFNLLRYPNNRISEDEFITHRILFSELSIALVEPPLYMYYQNPNSITKSEWSLKRLDVLDGLEEQIQYFHDNGYLSAYNHSLKVYTIALVVNISKLQSINGSKAIEKQLIKKLRWLLIKKGYVLKGDEHCLWCYDTAFPGIMNVFWIVKNKIEKFR